MRSVAADPVPQALCCLLHVLGGALGSILRGLPGVLQHVRNKHSARVEQSADDASTWLVTGALCAAQGAVKKGTGWQRLTWWRSGSA